MTFFGNVPHHFEDVGAQDGGVEVESFLAAADELLGIFGTVRDVWLITESNRTGE